MSISLPATAPVTDDYTPELKELFTLPRPAVKIVELFEQGQETLDYSEHCILHRNGRVTMFGKNCKPGREIIVDRPQDRFWAYRPRGRKEALILRLGDDIHWLCASSFSSRRTWCRGDPYSEEFQKLFNESIPYHTAYSIMLEGQYRMEVGPAELLWCGCTLADHFYKFDEEIAIDSESCLAYRPAGERALLKLRYAGQTVYLGHDGDGWYRAVPATPPASMPLLHQICALLIVLAMLAALCWLFYFGYKFLVYLQDIPA